MKCVVSLSVRLFERISFYFWVSFFIIMIKDLNHHSSGWIEKKESLKSGEKIYTF